MKKFLVLLGVILLGTAAFADVMYVETNLNMDNFWEKNGKDEQKVLNIGHRILYKNKISKRIPIIMNRSTTEINATSQIFDKTVTVYSGILPYIDSDDELAAVMAHEIAHSVEAYGGPIKYIAMNVNSKSYEIKADLKGIDYMVNAGYNPIAAIIVATKIYPEPMWDWGFTSTHPKGSKRVMAMYKYIYKKYPQFLNSDMTHSIYYRNFEFAMEREIQGYLAKQKWRQSQKPGNV